MSTVTVKGQVTIPKPIRDFLDIRPGSSVEFVMDADGQVVVRKVGAQQPVRPRFDRVIGSAGPGMSTDEIMALLRGDD
jgi:AbrB family looped-hinge helix DNA binding protein